MRGKKLTQAQIDYANDLRSRGLTQSAIAKMLGISQKTVCYWLAGEPKRKAIIKKIVENFRKKSEEEKQKIYKGRLNYIKKYLKIKYHTDKQYREKKKAESRKYYLEHKHKRKEKPISLALLK